MTPLPLTVLTGFLGAGKTTLLRRALAEARRIPGAPRIGLVINERGPTGIDSPDASARLVELLEGCACCLDQPDLDRAVAEMAARGDVDRIVLETSGLADPMPLTWALARREVTAHAALDGVLAVVDAANWRRVVDTSEWQAQVSCADLVVVSKLDLVAGRELVALRAAIRDANPGARVLEGTDEAPLGILLGDTADAWCSGGDGRGMPDGDGDGDGGPRARHSSFDSVAIAGERTYAAADIEDLLEDLPHEVFRAKGIVRLGDGRWASFQAVGGRLHFDLHAEPPSHGQSRLLFSGRGVRDTDLVERVAACEL